MTWTVESELELGLSLRSAKDGADAAEGVAFGAYLEAPCDESQRRWGKALKEQSEAEDSYRAWRTTFLYRA